MFMLDKARNERILLIIIVQRVRLMLGEAFLALCADILESADIKDFLKFAYVLCIFLYETLMVYS